MGCESQQTPYFKSGRLSLVLFRTSAQCSRQQQCPTLFSYSLLSLVMAMATYNQTDFEENEMSSENISSLGPLKELKSLDFNDMVNVISYFSMSLGE